jgi:hypothetical protein
VAGLRDAAEAARRLGELARELRAEFTKRDGDFGRMVKLADAIGESADGLADAFERVDALLSAVIERGEARVELESVGDDLIEALSPRGRSPAPTSDQRIDALTREELYARARAAGIPGRSKMSREELIEALRRAEHAGD